MHVYVAVLGYSETTSSRILGIYKEKCDAINRCMKEPCFVREGWTPSAPEKWSNLSGLYAEVQTHTLK